MSHLTDARQRKDDYFAHSPSSPLTPEQRRRFQGLAYYPENPDLVIVAALLPVAEDGIVELPTSGGETQRYRRAGLVRFSVEGRPTQVTLFESDPHQAFFVPFRDATSGTETYPAGRYLEVDRPRNGRVVVDFNDAYNPYCAYNAQWSCPLPPRENWLAVPIRAGERDYPDRLPDGHTPE